MNTTREIEKQIALSGATNITEETNELCECYSYTSRQNNPSLLVFKNGKAAKPYIHKHFVNEEQRDNYRGLVIERLTEIANEKAELAKAKKAFKTSIKVGDFINTCWGYEQTNVEFYQVISVAKSGKSIVVREVAKDQNYTTGMSGTCTPVKDSFISEEVKCRVSLGDNLKIDRQHASLWNQRPVSFSSWY